VQPLKFSKNTILLYVKVTFELNILQIFWKTLSRIFETRYPEQNFWNKISEKHEMNYGISFLELDF